MTLTVSVPAILIWSFGIPSLFLILLKRELPTISAVSSKEKLGFLYMGYKKETYYWEIVIMLTKMLIVLSTVMAKWYGAMVFLIININKKPFLTEELTHLETTSLVVTIITIFVGLFFASSTPKSDNSFNEGNDCKEAVKF
jgi:hypothetical protein